MLGVPEGPGTDGIGGWPCLSVISKHRDQIGKEHQRACTFSLLTAPGSGGSVTSKLRESLSLALMFWVFQAGLCP